MKTGLFVSQRACRCALAFTLTEVVVAVMVVAIVFVSLYAGIFFSFGVTKSEREDLRATQVMLQQMEGIRLFNWHQITDTNLNPPEFYERYFPGSAGVPPSGLTYTGNVVVAPVTLSPTTTYATNIQQLTVTVQWSSDGVPHTRSINTYIARDGIQNYVYTY